MEQFPEDLRFVVEEAFDRGKTFFGAALDHVAGEGPGGSGKAQDGNVGPNVIYGATQGFHQEAGFFLGIKDVEFFYIGFRSNWLRKIRTCVLEFEGEAHGFGRNQDIGEDNDGIDAETAEGLKGHFDGQFGSLTYLQKRVLSADFAILGEVAASLAHHPNREAGDRLAATGPQK